MIILSAVILTITLIVFAFGRSPVFLIDRAGIAIIGGILTVATGILSFDQAVRYIDFRTILLLFSMMIVTGNLKRAGFFGFCVYYMIKKFKTKNRLLLGVVLTSGLLSAFFINDIVCLLLTPIIIMVCKKMELPPVPYLIGVATASNVGSAGTILGNPQNILIGNISNVGFFNYFTTAFPLALVGLVVNYYVIKLLYSESLKGEINAGIQAFRGYHRYLMGKSIIVTAAILAGFIFYREPALIAGLGAAYLLVTRRVKPDKIYADIDFNLLVIFCGLFVIVGGVEQSGLLKKAIDVFHFDNFFSFSIITVVMSNVFSNVPAVMLLKSFIPLSNSGIWWIGLGVFSTFAGNLTLTGSIANLIVVENAKQEGVKITFGEYFKVGFLLTVILTLLALSYFMLFI